MQDLAHHGHQCKMELMYAWFGETYRENAIGQNRYNTRSPHHEAFVETKTPSRCEPLAQSGEGHFRQCESVLRSALFHVSVTDHDSEVFSLFGNWHHKCFRETRDFDPLSVAVSKSQAFGVIAGRRCHPW